MKKASAELIDKTFKFSILLKGLNGLLEIIGGILLLVIQPRILEQFVVTVTQGELSTDPHDFFANLLLKAAHDLSVSGQIFGALFLLSHGVVKLFLIIALYKRKLWAYSVAIVVFALFIVYQIYRYVQSHSVLMIILSALDVFVIWLTYLEYKNLKTNNI